MNVLLLARGADMGHRVLQAAAATGAAVHVLCEPRGRALAASRHARKVRVARARFDEAAPDAAIAEINRCIADLGIGLVAAGDPVTTSFMIRFAARLAAPVIPGPDPATFGLLNDKWRFTQLALSLGLACPESRLFEDRAALAAALEAGEVAAPAITKPLSQSGGAGVRRLEGANLAGQLARIDYQPVLYQDLVRGLDVDATIYCDRGEILSCVTYRRERGVYHFHDCQGVRDDLARLAGRLSLTGIYNFDLVYGPQDGARCWLECNPRVFSSIAMLAFVGLNYFDFALSGRPLPETAERHRRALAALAGTRLRRWNALAADTVRLERQHLRDWRFLAYGLSDLGPVVGRLLA